MEQLGRYALIEHIGDDPPWRLYRATSEAVGSPYRGPSREVVVRRLSYEPWDAAGKLLLDEARLALALVHDRIERVLEWDPGELYCVTELLHGWHLDRLVRVVETMPPAAACYVVGQVGEALQHVHALELAGDLLRQLPRRPLTPAAVLITVDWTVSLKSPALALLNSRQPALVSLSSPRVLERLSPEEVIGLRADHRSDVYHLGLLLHELITATRIFGRTSSFETLAAIRDEPPVEPSKLRPDVPRQVDDVVTRALAKDPEARHATSGHFVEEVNALCHDLGWTDGRERLRAYVEQTGLQDRPGPAGFIQPLAASR